MAWFSGTWVGGEGGTHIEESWSEPHGNSMVGSFRMLKGGAPQFYELMSIEREGEPYLLPIGEMVFERWEAGKPRIVGYAAKWR